MKNIKADFKFLLPVILMGAAIAVMAFMPSLPLRYAPGPDTVIVKYHSYFNIFLFAYAQFFPAATAVLSCIWLLLSLLAGRYRHGSFKLLSPGELISAKSAVTAFGIAAAACSGICVHRNISGGLFSPGSVIIFALLSLALILQAIFYFSQSLK
ncbi:hypothetical protein [Acutalibacter sp. 1XD8-36]|uniref:hypothetical protein n=1 Tax=Acutalibacter sp. 1XD8-36 TaxID=2320852 RepID=UPI00262E1B26|nr:hypothetical protein [Acutalibacter sp. 1XD8-36]